LLTEESRVALLSTLEERAVQLDAASDLSHLDGPAREALAARVSSGWDGLRHRALATQLRDYG